MKLSFISLLVLSFTRIVGANIVCGCADCTDAVLDKMAGDYTCRARIEWLQSAQNYSEIDACKKVAGDEFPGTCGPMCDPKRCGLAPSPVTPFPTFVSAPPSPLYCFPPDGSRVSFENVWGRYIVEVKEDQAPCGPGNNLFSPAGVSKKGNELSLKFQKRNGRWEGAEVRVVLPNSEKYLYGDYKFHVKSVDVMDSNGSSVSNVLPKDIVLGLFTWDDTERYSVHENWNHEVDIEVARWGSQTNKDVQFLMQPPGDPQMYRFFSGSEGSYSQSNHTHSFEWLPGKIQWQSSAGGGQNHVYTTEDAVKSGRRDYIQCLPAEMEIRMNLWNMHGSKPPDGLADDQYIEVVINDFVYEPAVGVSFIEPGEYCSKHCQCEGSCMNGKCVPKSPSVPTPPVPTPTPPSVGACGCSTCTTSVLDRNAGGHKVGDRIGWLEDNKGMSEIDACKTVCGTEFPSVCGRECNPDSCGGEGPVLTPSASTSSPTSGSTLSDTASPSAPPSGILLSVCNDITPNEYTLPARFGKTNHCYRIQVRNGGRILVDTKDPGCAKFNAGNNYSGVPVSKYRRTIPGGIAIYKGRWVGFIELVEDPSLTKAQLKVSGNTSTRTFSGTLIVPNCNNKA